LEQRCAPLRGEDAEGLALQRHELAVAAVNPAVHTPGVELRQVAQPRDQDDDEGYQYDRDAADQARQPEWQVTIGEALVAGSVVAVRFRVQRKRVGEGTRELVR